MFVKKIRLKNFKSFKKAEIVFSDPFTVITGPNGSGKSNIIDSILFCLGITTSKTLRAEKLTDLIRNEQSEAEVVVELEGFTVGRRIKKTEKGYYSYYYLNGRSVNYSEIRRILEDLCLNSEYNVIMQGDVTRIAEMSPFQRRKIIDDIAGISEFDEKKEKALEELEIVKTDIEKLDVLIAEVEERLKQLKVERDEALRYRSLVEERDKLKGYLRVHEYLKLKSKFERISKEIESINEDRDRLAKEIIDLNEKLIDLNGRAKAISEKISNFRDDRLKAVQDGILKKTSEIEGLKRLIDVQEEEISRLEREREKNLLMLSKRRDELTDVEEEVKELEVQLESLNMVLDEKLTSLELLRMKYEELSAGLKTFKDSLEEKIGERERLREKRLELLRERDKILEGLRRISMEIEEIEVEKKRVEIEKTLERLRENEDKFKKLEGVLDKLKSTGSKIDKTIFKLRDMN